MYRLVITINAQKSLNKLSLKDKKRIDSGFNKIIENPFSGKKLNGELQDKYSIKIWPYRIIYEIRKQILLVIILKVGHRKNVYKK